MSDLPENYELLPDLLLAFNTIGGYWDINQSEDNNIEIKWAPFVSKTNMYGQVYFMDDIFMKRCYDLKDFIELCIKELEETKEDLRPFKELLTSSPQN